MLHFFFGFHGRIRRTNYFLGALVTGLVASAFTWHWAYSGYWDGDWGWPHRHAMHLIAWPMMSAFWAVGSVVGLACWVAQFALAAKRWHDAGATGWLALLNLIAWPITFLILCLLPPSPNASQYGPDPRTSPRAYA